jgi:Sulfotransferase family
MSSGLDNRRKTWSPPPRPDWVSKMNEEGRFLDLESVIPLDENSLLGAARNRTGLSDFGDDSGWYESFQVFIKSLNEEANLNLVGRLMTRSDLVNILAGRLQITQTYKDYPEIEDEVISQPLMIVGQPRTGTSLLLNVLSQDSGNGPLRHWECMFPCPPPEKQNYFSDPRIELAEHQIQMLNRVNPEMLSCHEFYALVPTEIPHAMTFDFSGSTFLAMLGQTPSHNRFLQQVGAKPGLLYLKRMLKLLQWKNPRQHWLLKAPEALLFMPELLEVFPDMNFIWNHRDPLKAVSSVVNMWGNCTWMRSDTPFVEGVVEELMNADNIAATLNRAIDWLEHGVIPRDRICHMDFLALEKDPVREVKKIYEHFSITLTSAALEAMERYMAMNPRSSRPPAKYHVEQGDGVSAERSALKRYQDYFQVSSEF